MTNIKYTISVIGLHLGDNYLFSEFHSPFSSANPLKFTEEVSTGLTLCTCIRKESDSELGS